MSDFFSGSGPGERTSDGCSVALYARMPYLGELDDVRPLLTPGTSVLELGAGAGRLVAPGKRVGQPDATSREPLEGPPARHDPDDDPDAGLPPDPPVEDPLDAPGVGEPARRDPDPHEPPRQA